MTYRIAIQPDSVRHPNGVQQSFSDRWIQRAKEFGIEVQIVDVFGPTIFDQLAGCDGFMWRFGFLPSPRLFAKRLLPAIEQGLGIPVFPTWKSCWHFEDKIAQHYLLQAAQIPTPRTWIFWHRDHALTFCNDASYPLVIKLANGFQSENVRLIHGRKEAEYWLDQLFGPGAVTLSSPPTSRRQRTAVRARQAARLLIRGQQQAVSWRGELQQGYLYAQEFLSGNTFDTRVTVIGNRAFAFRRFNRADDFRASGSGQIDWDPQKVDLETVRLAFRVAQQLGTQSVAIDGLRRNEDRVVNEISYTYASWAVHKCPGHWVLRGDPQMDDLGWVEGQLAPEDAIFDDFMAHVRLAKTSLH